VRAVSRIRSKIVSTTLQPRELDPVIMQLLGCVARTHDVAGILRSAAVGCYAEDRIGDALADVIHRSLFGLQEDVNVHGAPPEPPPTLHFDAAVRDAFRQGEARPELASPGHKTWEALIEAGRKVFVERGYHRTRVGDVVEAAGVSRGAFYRYFGNKDQLARALATRALQTVSQTLSEIPAPALHDGTAGTTLLRRWLRRYSLTQSNEAAMLRVWVDAALQDATLRANSAAALDWGRRAMVRFIEQRGFGDVHSEGLVMLALLSSFGARERTSIEVGAAAHIIEQGLLGVSRR
jgi:AcrR family transcriptional regulator